MVIINGVIHTGRGGVIPEGFVAWEGERIVGVGPMDALAGDHGPALDARGGHVCPGFVDAHSHLGLFPDSRDYSGAVADGPGPISPGFDPLAHADLTDRCFSEALAAGVTAAAIAPGSKNPVGGRVACVRTDGRVIDPFVALKLALGETPERATGLDRAGLVRMLEEALSGLEPEVPVHLHVHRAADIAAALALQDRLGRPLVLVHGTDAPQLAGELARREVSVITGPAMTDRSRGELKNLCPELPARLARAGVRVSICTDHPETPAQFLPLCAALAVRGGMDPEEALAAVTRHPALTLGLGSRLGALCPGMDADILVTPGHPLDVTKKPSAVILGGKRVV